MQKGSKSDFAIAGEPTNCRIVYTHKGAIAFKIITRGKSAHSSMPERGESAIKKMAGVVEYLLGEYADSLKQIHNAELGSPTTNVGVIRGRPPKKGVPDPLRDDGERPPGARGKTQRNSATTSRTIVRRG